VVDVDYPVAHRIARAPQACIDRWQGHGLPTRVSTQGPKGTASTHPIRSPVPALVTPLRLTLPPQRHQLLWPPVPPWTARGPFWWPRHEHRDDKRQGSEDAYGADDTFSEAGWPEKYVGPSKPRLCARGSHSLICVTKPLHHEAQCRSRATSITLGWPICSVYMRSFCPPQA
jgi:hypothetical protein